jgi:dethiobiotin synthetase
MTKRFLITAANTDCGKTYITALLLQALASRGVKVGAIKPIETGVEETPADASLLHHLITSLNPNLSALELCQVVPITMRLPAAPAVAKTKAIDYAKIKEAIAYQEQFCDVILIESAGGILTPLDERYDVIDLVDLLQATPIFVATDKLGMMSETKVNLAYFKAHNIAYHWGINLKGKRENFDLINRGYLEHYFGKFTLFQDDIESFIDEILCD